MWGHRSAGFSRARGNWEVEQQQAAKARSLADRWAELTRKIQLWVEIHELNDQGEYAPVEVSDVITKSFFFWESGCVWCVRGVCMSSILSEAEG